MPPLFCEEGEELEKALHRLTEWRHRVGSILYMSLTWNTENRFGGGAHTDIGLKNDGKRLLEYLCEHQIAVDLSHTSDRLAYELLNEIDKRNYQIPVIASHSNARAVCNAPRNLPDDLIKEIVRRKGLIGMNFVRFFLGSEKETAHNFTRHFEHFCTLGALSHLCFGADFFNDEDLSPAYRKPPGATFFPAYDNASTYSNVLNQWRQQGGVSEDALLGVCYGNARKFIESLT